MAVVFVATASTSPSLALSIAPPDASATVVLERKGNAGKRRFHAKAPFGTRNLLEANSRTNAAQPPRHPEVDPRITTDWAWQPQHCAG